MLVRLAGFEPAAYGLEVRCSIQLSYRRIEFDRSIAYVAKIVHRICLAGTYLAGTSDHVWQPKYYSF